MLNEITIYQELEDIINSSKIHVRVDKETYVRRRKRFGQKVEEMMRVAVFMGQVSDSDIPTSEIWIKFANLPQHISSDCNSYGLRAVHKDKVLKNGRIIRTAVITISFLADE